MTAILQKWNKLHEQISPLCTLIVKNAWYFEIFIRFFSPAFSAKARTQPYRSGIKLLRPFPFMCCLHSKWLLRGSYNFFSLVILHFLCKSMKSTYQNAPQKEARYWRRFCFHSDLSSSNNYTKHTQVCPYLPSTCMGDNITMTTEQGDTRQARKIAVDTQVLPLRGSWLAQIIFAQVCCLLWEFE